MAMLKTMLTVAATLGAMTLGGTAMAQTAPAGGILVIYGNDKCPTNNDGDEIVICQRLDEAERYRIPEVFRGTEVKPQNESWATRQQGALAAGATGTGSCSTVGASGGTGCFVQQATIAKAEYRARKKALNDLPLP
jgi:hypothetical protein